MNSLTAPVLPAHLHRSCRRTTQSLLSITART